MKTEYDFGFGLVSAHQHPNGGGWVADTATVDPTAYVGQGVHQNLWRNRSHDTNQA